MTKGRLIRETVTQVIGFIIVNLVLNHLTHLSIEKWSAKIIYAIAVILACILICGVLKLVIEHWLPMLFNKLRKRGK